MREPSGGAKALVKGLAILDLLTAHSSGLRLTEIVEMSGMPKGTTSRLLRPLLDLGAVAVDAAGVYRLGSRCAAWGSAFLESVDVRRLAHDVMTGLAERSGETCHLGIPKGRQVLYIDKVDSRHAVRMVSRIGGLNPVHCTALGKAMLAFLPEAEITAIIGAGLERRTENTITDADTLLREIALIRRRGYAIDDVENEDGVRCVAAPIFDHRGLVIASISAAGPMYRISRERLDVLGGQVRDAADEISRRLGSDRPGHLGRPGPDSQQAAPERSLV